MKNSGREFAGLDVLVAEDVERMRLLLRAMLESFGVVRIREAGDGEAAYRAVWDRAPDLLITDFEMRPVHGAELVRRIRRDEDSPNPYLPVIMVTAYSDHEHLAAARGAGVNEILRKPVSAKALRAHMIAVLESPRPFIRAPGYFGPDRRRRAAGVQAERRAPGAGAPG